MEGRPPGESSRCPSACACSGSSTTASSGATSASRCSCSWRARTSCLRSRCPRRVVAIVVGSLIGNAMLGVAGLIGADARVPAMVLMRAPLGQRGSWGPTVINAAQCVGWSIFELLIIATAVAALSDEVLGFRAQWLWTLLFGADRARARTARADRLRPEVRPQVRGLGGARLAALPDVVGARRRRARQPLGPRTARAGRPCSQGVDLVVAITVSWIPLAADYTRFSRTRAGALPGLGRRVPRWRASGSGCWARSSSSRATSPIRRRCPSRSRPAASARRSRCSPSPSTRPTRRSRTSTRPRSRSRTSRRGCRSARSWSPSRSSRRSARSRSTSSPTRPSCSCSARSSSRSSASCSRTGSRRASHYSEQDVFGGPAVRPGMIGAWIAGFAAYQWLYPTGPALVGRPRREARSAGLGHRRVASELRGLARAGARHRDARQAALLEALQ